MRDLKVVKKNGKIEDFDSTNIYNACIAAGASDELADKVTKLVVDDLHKIESKKIREKTIEILKELNKNIADNWIKYDIEHAKQKKSIMKL